MTRARQDGLCLLFLGASIVILLTCFLLDKPSFAAFEDFRSGYFSARCLLQDCDPYSDSEVLRIYQEEGGEWTFKNAQEREIATRYMYPPTVFAFTVPFALLPWGPAHTVWLLLSVSSLLLASYLAWSLGANYAPILSGALIGYLLANTLVLIVLSNPSGIVVGLCTIAVWCFLQERFVPAGILCLAVSLAVKPQDPGLIWLYFFLAGGVYRRRAMQTLLVTIGLSLPGILWVWHVAPHWIQELHSNIAAFAVHGGLNDPGPSSRDPHSMVDLQVIISRFWDDPRIYNPVSYLICAPLLIVWGIVTLRSRFSPSKAWLAIASIAALSMLPIYHHLYDTKLLLLTVPACAMLWAEGGRIGRLALMVTTAGFVLTGDISGQILFSLIDSLHPDRPGAVGWILRAMQVFPAPLILLTMSIFYLWVYVQRARSAEGATEAEGSSEAHTTPAQA